MPPPIKPQAFLAKLPLFRELSPTLIDRIAAGTTEHHAPKGEILFNRGDPCLGFHLLIYGQVKLSFVTKQGSEKVVEIIGPGQSFGEALMFADKPYVVMAQALADSLLLHVSRDVVDAEIARDPAFARALLAGLSQRLHGLVQDVESYSLETGRQRVIGYLLSHGPEAAGSGPSTVTLPVSKALVASRLNLTPEHFSRIMHDLGAEKLIEVDGRDIRILDVTRLRGSPA